MVGKKQTMSPVWKKFTENVVLDEPSPFLRSCTFGMHPT